MERWVLILLVVPLMLAQLAATLPQVDLIWTRAFIGVSLGFLAYWTWVGDCFARLSLPKPGAFLLGNSLTLLLCLVLYLGYFTPVDPWPPLWHSAHLHALFALPLSLRLATAVGWKGTSLFSPLVLGKVLMVIAFSLGFFSSRIRARARR